MVCKAHAETAQHKNKKIILLVFSYQLPTLSFLNCLVCPGMEKQRRRFLIQRGFEKYILQFLSFLVLSFFSFFFCLFKLNIKLNLNTFHIRTILPGWMKILFSVTIWVGGALFMSIQPSQSASAVLYIRSPIQSSRVKSV